MTWHGATRRARRRTSSLSDQGRAQAKEKPSQPPTKAPRGIHTTNTQGRLSTIYNSRSRPPEQGVNMIALEIISTTTALAALIAGSAGAGFFAGLLAKDIAKYGL